MKDGVCKKRRTPRRSPQSIEDGFSIFIVAALFLWDCWVYSNRAIIEISHDEVGTLYQLQDLQASGYDIPEFLASVTD